MDPGDFTDESLRELVLADVKGLDKRFREHLVEVARVFDHPDQYVEQKGRLHAKVTIGLTFELDVEAGTKRIAFVTDFKPPKRLGRAMPIYRRRGQFLVRDEPEQIPLATVRKIEGDTHE